GREQLASKPVDAPSGRGCHARFSGTKSHSLPGPTGKAAWRRFFWRPVLTNIVKEKPMQKRMFVIFLLLFAAVTLAAQSKKLRPGFNLFSKEQDVQLGKESA